MEPINHITPSHYHLPLSYRSLVDQYGSLGSLSYRLNFLNLISPNYNNVESENELACLKMFLKI